MVSGAASSLAVEARGLTKQFGRTVALKTLGLQVRHGERLAVFGPNGSGKTTLIKVLGGLLRPSGGTVRIAGLDPWRDGPGARRLLGVVTHHPLLYEDLTAEENLLFFGRMFGLERLEQAVSEALRRVGLENRRRDKVRALSRGMQQRLAIARATLHRPAVLLLDEPDTGLDRESSAKLGEMLGATGGTDGAMVIATHNIRLGLGLCSRFAILAGGRITYLGSRAEVDEKGLEELYREHASASGRPATG